MAMQTEEILKIIADVDPAIKNIDQLEKKLEALRAKAKTIDFKADPQGYEKTQKEITKLEIAQSKLKNSTSQMSAEMRRASGEVKGFGDAAAVSGGIAIALGQTFSDIGQFGFGMAQGIRAIANNISQLATLFAVGVAQAGGFNKALKGLFATMKGPLGIVVAIQAVIGALDLWASSQRKAKKETEDLTNNMDDGVFKVNALYQAYTKMNPETENARKIKKELSKQLKVNIDDYKDLSQAVAAHTKLVNAMALSDKIATDQKDLLTKQMILNTELSQAEEDVINARTNAQINSNKQFDVMDGMTQRINYSTIALSEAERKRSKIIEEINKLTNERLKNEKQQEQLQALITELLKEDTKEKKKNADATEKQLKQYKLLFNILEQDADVLKRIREELHDSQFDLLSEEGQYIDSLYTQYSSYYARLNEFRSADLISESEYLMYKVWLQESYMNRLSDMNKKDIGKMLDLNDKAQNDAIDRIHRTEQAKMKAASNTFGFLISLNQALAGESETERRKAFRRDKALRVAQATIDTYSAANSALKSGGGATPLGISLMVATIAAGLANVTTILGQQYNGESTSATTANVGGIQGGYPYPMSGFSTIQPQFPDRTGSLEIIPRIQRIVVVESDITDAQKAQVDRGYRASVGG